MIRYIQFFALLLTTLTGCQEYSPQEHYVSMIIDRSEKDSYAPQMDDIKTYWSDANDADAITLSLCYVSDTQYGTKYSFILGKAEVGWLSNESKRRNTRRQFLRQIKDSLQYYNNMQKPLMRSDIFRVVIRELNEASKQTADVDVLLFSDLREHSSLFSTYNLYQRKQLLENTDAMAERIIGKVQPANDLSEVTLRIIYKPTIEEAPIFSAMVKIYRHLVESRGGKVLVGRHTKIQR